MAKPLKKELQANQLVELLHTLKIRFEKNINRHIGIDWIKVDAKLKANPQKLWSLFQMEVTGGEPDVVSFNKNVFKLIGCFQFC